MGIEAIQEEIENQAKKIAETKVGEASLKANEIKEETLRIIKEEDKKSEKETNDLIESIKAVIESSAKFEVKKLELNSRKEMINQVFEKAARKITSLDEKTQKELVSALMQKATEEIKVAKVLCNEKTRKLVPKEYKTEAIGIIGGIIAETADGRLRVDYSYETIIEEVRRDALRKVAKTIF